MDVLTLANSDKTKSKFFFKRRTNMNLNSLHSNSKLTVEISKGYQKVLADTVFCVKNECVDTKGQLISKCLFGVFNPPKKRTKTIWLEVP